MMKLHILKVIPFLFIFFLLYNSCEMVQEVPYYSDKNNYIILNGIVDYIRYSDDGKTLYLRFSDLDPDFSDCPFKIVGKNLKIAQKNGIDEKMEIGDEVEFITAPRYFGDGYIVPIAGISVDGEVLLDFEQGYENYIDWIG